MGARPDLIAVVENCYRLFVSEPEWLQGIANSIHAVVEPHGLLAYHVDIDRLGPRILSPVHVGSGPNMVPRIQQMAALLERKREGRASLLDNLQAKLYEHVIRSGLRQPADCFLLSEHKKVGPDWMYTLGAPGIHDLFHLMNHHIDGNGVTALVAGLRERGSLRSGQRANFQMLSAHIKAGMRLRRRLSKGADRVAAPPGGAILDSAAQVLHADGEACERTTRDALQEHARAIDRARTEKSGRGSEALGVWQGLIRGSWSLVEQFDSDGRRFMLAHKNPEQVRDPRGLTDMEARVVGLATRGYSDKLIAYHLGVAEGTASSHLTLAMRKLRVSNRVELVRNLAPFQPTSGDDREKAAEQ